MLYGVKIPDDLTYYGGSKDGRAKQCDETIEKRYAGQRYVFSRARCQKKTKHPSGRCLIHRY